MAMLNNQRVYIYNGIVNMNGLMGISNKYTLVSCKSMVKRHYYIYIWVNFIMTSLFSLTIIVVNKGNYPQIALFQVSELF